MRFSTQPAETSFCDIYKSVYGKKEKSYDCN